jgi:hypothetical protein
VPGLSRPGWWITARLNRGFALDRQIWRIAVIKFLWDVAGLGLKEAKDVVETTVDLAQPYFVSNGCRKAGSFEFVYGDSFSITFYVVHVQEQSSSEGLPVSR